MLSIDYWFIVMIGPSWFLIWFSCTMHSSLSCYFFFFFNDTAPPDIYPLPLHDSLPIFLPSSSPWIVMDPRLHGRRIESLPGPPGRGPPCHPCRATPAAAVRRLPSRARRFRPRTSEVSPIPRR